MRRRDVVIISLRGEAGKPRPAVILQSDLLNCVGPARYLLAPFTSSLSLSGLPYRVLVAPDGQNGLTKISEIELDYLTFATRDRIGQTIGRLDDATMAAVDRALAPRAGVGLSNAPVLEEVTGRSGSVVGGGRA